MKAAPGAAEVQDRIRATLLEARRKLTEAQTRLRTGVAAARVQLEERE